MASIKKIEGKKGVSYKITVAIGRDEHGRQKRHYTTYRPPDGMPAREIRRELQKIVADFEQAFLTEEYQPDNQTTFREYADYVFSLKERAGLKPNTLLSLKNSIRRANEYIGNMRLVDIRPKHLNMIYENLSEPGACRCGVFAYPKAELIQIAREESPFSLSKRSDVSLTTWNRIRSGERVRPESAEKVEKFLEKAGLFTMENTDEFLSVGTIKEVHRAIYGVLDRAYKEMIIRYNPATRVILPKNKRKREVRTLQPDEVQAVQAALQSEPIQLQALITLFLCTGCRRGEALGLKWDKIDLERDEITIDCALLYTPSKGYYISSTKTGNKRRVAIPAELTALLMRHKADQAARRLRYADMWKDAGFVFTTEFGGEVNPQCFNKTLSDFCKRHDLPHIHPHMFRHTAASLLIANGVDVVSVAASLGHKDISTTLNTYSHEIEEARRKTADTMSKAIFHQKNA